MTKLDQAVLDVARDAIREGKPELLQGIVADQPKCALLGEMLRAAASLARSLGVQSISLCPFEHDAYITMGVDEPEGVDRVAEDLVASGASLIEKPYQFKGTELEWRQATATLGNLRITVNGPHRNLTPAEKRKRTLEAKRKERERQINNLTDDGIYPPF